MKTLATTRLVFFVLVVFGSKLSMSQVQTGGAPPPGGYFPPSMTACPIDAPVDASPNPADHVIPSEYAPTLNTPLLIGNDGLSQGQIRAIAFDGTKVLKVMAVQRTYVPPAPKPHTWTLNITAVGGVPVRQQKDGYDPFALYTGPGFHYRLELCMNGKFQPVTSPKQTEKLGFSPTYLDDTYYVVYGKPETKPTADSVLTSISIVFPPKQVSVHIDISSQCNGIPGVAANSDDSATASVKLGVNGPPVAVPNLGVTIFYDGTVHGNPITNPAPGHGDPPSPIQDRGDIPDSSVTSGYVDSFPYGSPLNKSGNNVSSINIDNNVTAIHIGGACRGFTAAARAKLVDGQIVVATIHSK